MDSYYEYRHRSSGSTLRTCWYAFLGIIAVLLLASLTSCKSVRYVTVEKVRTDTTYITKHQRDSIWLHDSIHVTEKGDTVRIEKWHTKYVEKEVHDTLYQSRTDSIPVPYPVKEYVKKPLSWWQKTLQRIGGAVLMAAVLLLILHIVGKDINRLLRR